MDEVWVKNYENDLDYIESLNGIDWADAPLPSRWHKCKTQTRGWFGLNYTERCACGATRISGRWIGKNETRKNRLREEREAATPKSPVICHICGKSYEAIAGSTKAKERLCDSCWGKWLVKKYGGREARQK